MVEPWRQYLDLLDQGGAQLCASLTIEVTMRNMTMAIANDSCSTLYDVMCFFVCFLHSMLYDMEFYITQVLYNTVLFCKSSALVY